MQSISYSIEPIDHNHPEYKYLLQFNNKTYYLGELVGFIIQQMSFNKSFDDILLDLNNKYEGIKQFSSKELQDVIDNHINRLGLNQKSADQSPKVSKNTPGIIFGEKAIFYPDRHTELLKTLSFFTKDNISVVLMPIALLASLGFFLLHKFDYAFYTYKIEAVQSVLPAGVSMLIVLVGIMLLIFFHELGHASAAYGYGIISKKICFGFYLVFPMLNTDVTETWKLNKRQRLMVNLGGIYFQSLMNLVLIAAFLLVPDVSAKKMLLDIILASVLIIIINLIPFVKFDGYWIYSDFFGIVNLQQQAGKLIQNFYRRIFFGNKKDTVAMNSFSKPLIVYSFMSALTSIIFTYVLYDFTSSLIDKTSTLIVYSLSMDPFVFSIPYGIELGQVLLMALVLTWLLTKNLSNYIGNASNG